jgi:hypothetical protein
MIGDKVAIAADMTSGLISRFGCGFPEAVVLELNPVEQMTKVQVLGGMDRNCQMWVPDNLHRQFTQTSLAETKSRGMYAVPRNKVVRAAFYQIYCVQ